MVDVELFGEPSEAYLEFKKSCVELPPFSSANPDLAKHYLLTDGTVCDIGLIRGTFEARNFQARSNDIVVASFPKTGTTWLQQIAYIIGSDLDFESASSIQLEERFPYLEWPSLGLDALDPSKPQRFIKTHLHYSCLHNGILENKPKILYITRNPKDTIVSMYHFYRLVVEYSFTGPFEEFFDLFLNNRVIMTPYPRHVLEFWNHRNDDNILFITYESLQKECVRQIMKIADFLGKSLSEDKAAQVADACKFSKMAANKNTNYDRWGQIGAINQGEKFMRKGKVADWKNYFDDEMNSKMDKWIEKHFSGSGLVFEYD